MYGTNINIIVGYIKIFENGYIGYGSCVRQKSFLRMEFFFLYLTFNKFVNFQEFNNSKIVIIYNPQDQVSLFILMNDH